MLNVDFLPSQLRIEDLNKNKVTNFLKLNKRKQMIVLSELMNIKKKIS